MNNTVLDKVVASRRLPILFIGSGISKRYLYHYPNWEELLELSFKKYNPDLFQLQKHKDSMERQGLDSFEINAKIASIIEDEFNAAYFDRKIRLNIGNPKNPSWVKRGISPFKMFLASYFRKMRLNTNSTLQEELSKFRQLKNRISAVITTNYDLFLENEVFSNDYTVFVNQNELFGADSYNIAEIYKIHGSASDAKSIVITEQDYNDFRESRKLIIAKMLTLFAESPIIFMGYSFSDENIQSIIVDFLDCLSKNDLENISEHFIFISYKKGEQNLSEIKRTIMTSSNKEIPITEIQTDNFSLVFDTLNKITPGISPLRVRETKRVIKTIVDANVNSEVAESVIVGIDDLENYDLSGKPLAIAIGYKENILSKFGYGVFDEEMIWEDILYDNKGFDSTRMCMERFKSIPITRLLPVFKYLRFTDCPLDPDSKLSKYVAAHNTLELIISKNIEKSLKNVAILTTYEELLNAISQQSDFNKKAGLLLKNISSFSIEEIRKICCILFDSGTTEEKKSSTNFKRCVMCLDLLENYNPNK